jgi:glycosyltransferase involved in cell wall biosynthesis
MKPSLYIHIFLQRGFKHPANIKPVTRWSTKIMEKVSVIIPTYNKARYIGRTVDSVLKQTYPNIEIIVVDDGSTDHTSDVLSQYQSTVSHIWQPNQGPSAARNTGLNASSGDFLLFLDSDDIVTPDKLALQTVALEKQSRLGRRLFRLAIYRPG